MRTLMSLLNRKERQRSNSRAKIDPKLERPPRNDVWNQVETQFTESAKPTPEEVHRLLCLLDESYGIERKFAKWAKNSSPAADGASGQEIARSQLEQLRQISILTATNAIRQAKSRRRRQAVVRWRAVVLVAVGIFAMWHLVLR